MNLFNLYIISQRAPLYINPTKNQSIVDHSGSNMFLNNLHVALLTQLTLCVLAVVDIIIQCTQFKVFDQAFFTGIKSDQKHTQHDTNTLVIPTTIKRYYTY